MHRFFLRSLWALAAALFTVSAGADEPSAERREELAHLLEQDCGSCHGMTMKGGLGPALTPEALTGKPVDFLVTTVLHGRPGTAMPPWGQFVNEAEARWLVEQLKRGRFSD